jgi:hypothetical protein
MSRLAVLVSAGAGLAVVAGCSSSGSSPQAAPGSAAGSSPASTAPAAGTSASSSTPAATSSSASPTATAGPCATSSLALRHGLSQGYAGGVYEVIDFTNTSSTACTLYGYPGVSLVSGSPYTQIGPAARRTTGTAIRLITLAPGATANALLQIVDALNYPPASCGPVKAAALKVYPPNQRAPVYLASTATACAKSVAVLSIGPVQAGSGGAG